MTLTNTQNSTLGRVLHFDASYISRIRNGNRGVPKHQPFIRPAAAFFAANLTEPYQRAAVMGKVNPGRSWPDSQLEAEEMIAGWLEEDPANGFSGEMVENMLSGLSQFEWKEPALPSIPEQQTTMASPYYYSNGGKRQAVERMLTELCRSGEAHTLLLFSNENMAWLSEDTTFLRRWAALLEQIIAAGGKIKIIHTVSRDAGEMFAALRSWMPLYLSGAIEPYYCPYGEASIFRRTLFLARRHCAVVSNSIEESTQGMLNQMIRDYGALEALELEFEAYLKVSRPLMQIYTARDQKRLETDFINYDSHNANLMIAGSMPSLFTMPPEVAGAIEARSQSSGLRDRCLLLKERVLKLMSQGGRVTEILYLPPKPQGKTLPLPLGEMYGMGQLFCTREELKAHLRELLRLMEQEPGYRVRVSSRVPRNVFISASEHRNVFVAKAKTPDVVFQITEQQTVSAMWDYLRQISDSCGNEAANRKKLERFIDIL